MDPGFIPVPFVAQRVSVRAVDPGFILHLFP